jgi:AcrR family transcriptional regulator
MQAELQVHIGSEALHEQRHVCALFDGPEAAYSVLAPFVTEGLHQGDRVVYLTERPETLPDRLDLGPAGSTATDSGQLDIRGWAQTYLADGSFVGSRMLNDVHRALGEGIGLGYPRTRLVGEMEWAQDEVVGIDELVAYESGIDDLLGRPAHAVVCAYDVRRHSASRIAAVLAAHKAAFVGGRLQRTNGRAASESSRERILAAASRLFGRNGVRATGVDALISSADVAKATFYRHFPSKDDVIVAWLKDPRTRWFEGVRAKAEAGAATPDDVIPRFFDALADWLEAGDYRGSAYLNTAIELGDPGHPAMEVVRSYVDEVRQYLAEIVEAAGYREPAAVAAELQTMVAGAITLGVALRSGAPAVAAREAASTLLANTPRVDSPRV